MGRSVWNAEHGDSASDILVDDVVFVLLVVGLESHTCGLVSEGILVLTF